MERGGKAGPEIRLARPFRCGCEDHGTGGLVCCLLLWPSCLWLYAPRSVGVASSHPIDLQTAVRPDCLPFFHIICIGTACAHPHPNHFYPLLLRSCWVTLPWEVRWRSSTWPAAGDGEWAWRDHPQINLGSSQALPRSWKSLLWDLYLILVGCRRVEPVAVGVVG